MELANARISYSACPLCEGRKLGEAMVADCSAHPLYKPQLPKKQRWLRCAGCGHLFVDGYFSPEALAILFSGTQDDQTPGYDIERQRDVWAPVVAAMNDVRGRLDGAWLDVGFGNGALMATAAEFGYDVVGLDARPDSARVMREFGFEAHALKFEAYDRAEPFDVVSMADVLEHVPFPKGALEHAWNLLWPGGHLLLSMPNADSFLWHALTQAGANPYWAEIEHYHNFGRRRLFALLEQCGFEPLRFNVSTRYRACMEVIARKREA